MKGAIQDTYTDRQFKYGNIIIMYIDYRYRETERYRERKRGGRERKRERDGQTHR